MNKAIILVFAGLFALNTSAQVSEKAISSAEVLFRVKADPATFGLTAEDLAESRISDHYSDKKSGLTHSYVQQYINGIPVFNGILGVHFNKSGNLVHHAGNCVSDAKSHLSGNHDLINFMTVFQAAAGQIADPIPDFSGFVKIDPSNRNLRFDESGKYYYSCWYNSDGKLIAAVNYIFFILETGDWLNLVISADGKVLERINWTSECNFSAHATAKSNAGDSSTFNALSFNIESPLYGDRSLLVNPHDTVASPYGWLDDDGIAGPDYTITRGNNVWASEDRDADNFPGSSPDGGASLNFDFSYDPSELDPLNYQEFAITNLFVVNNLMHDIMYHYGFDEAAGNFQFNNYSRGGTGGDEVNADAQDGSGSNNANFSTPPDGSNPRMQMYIWDATAMGGATLRINDSQKTTFKVGRAQFGDALSTIPITADLVYVNDGVGDGQKGCKSLKNGSALAGKIAAIERGGCLFVDKVLNAQNAGAIAAVILDTSSADVLITMSGSSSLITIPSVFVKLSNAGELQELLFGGPVNISLYDSSGTIPKTDSDLDLGVIAHEYGHGISIRLTCGPSNSNGLNNAEQMGEGWSDFLGLALTVKNGDLGSTPRGIGNWLIGEGKNGGGIRTYPYSTNMTINPHTYKNVMLNSVSGRTEVHYLGEVWCAMLWDLHWKMVEKYGYSSNLYTGTAGNNMAIQLIIEGMKLQKCQPGFVDGRNAILKADSLLYGAANSRLIWEVFARRGLGFSASQGSSFSTADGSEAFNLPPSLSNKTISAENNWVTVRPNPARDYVFVEPMSVREISSILLFDISGKQWDAPFTRNQNGALTVDLKDLSSGMYFLQVFSGDQKQVLKIHKD